MARFITGNTFNEGDQVTADTLNNAVNNAKISTDSIDSTSFEIDTGSSGAKIQLKDSTGTSDGVTFAKVQQAAANTVLVRDANSTGVISAKAVADTQILIGDGTGFTAAALSGDVTMTNGGVTNISDDVTLGGTPLATDAPAGTNSTRIATTAFVQQEIGNAKTPNNRLRIKVLPSHFTNVSYSTNGGEAQLDESNVYASYDIPQGYKATLLTLTVQRIDFYIYDNAINDRTSVSELGKNTSQSSSGSEETLSTGAFTATGDDNKYVTVKLTRNDGSNSRFAGGFITLVAV
tara:strand:+ start:802 stop:1674 length:873 start_codon:yes stop_codon:yes gene_type:complete